MSILLPRDSDLLYAAQLGALKGSLDPRSFTIATFALCGFANLSSIGIQLGGIGALAEFGAERWLREAMILAIWEGTAHRQMLDGLEAMERKRAHTLLFEHLGESGEMKDRVEAHLALPADEREATIEPLFRDLAQWTARCLYHRGT